MLIQKYLKKEYDKKASEICSLTGNYNILEKRIEKLASKGNPWYYNAVELKGFLFAKQKNKEKQIEIFNILSKDNKAPEGVRTRANDMLAILGEEPQK